MNRQNAASSVMVERVHLLVACLAILTGVPMRSTSALAQPLVVSRPAGFIAEVVQPAVRQMRRSMHGLDRAEHRLLDDLSRSSSRYGFTAVSNLLEIAARCREDADAFAFVDAARGYIVARRHVLTLSVVQAFGVETEKQFYGDLSQFRWLDERSGAARDGAIEALTAHQHAVARAIDALYSDRTPRLTAGRQS